MPTRSRPGSRRRTCWPRRSTGTRGTSGRGRCATSAPDAPAFRPAYLALAESGTLARRAEEATAALAACALCPRDCRVNRAEDEAGVCRLGRRAKVASSFAHRGEERCLSGTRGSGTVFFSGCGLRCVFCQNWETSNLAEGEEVDAAGLAAIFLELQGRGCHNLNLVTPSHVVPQVLEALVLAAGRGLALPIVYNTGGYDALEALRLMDGVVDVYMPDFKLWESASCRAYLRAADYPGVARAALAEMHRQVGDLVLDGAGLARRGVLVRHLVMPGLLEETGAVLRWIARALGPATYVNVMGQYRPCGLAARAPERYPAIARPTSGDEHARAIALARAAGLTRLDGFA